MPLDYTKAYMWLNMAAASGDENSILAKGEVAKRMTSAAIEDAQRMARECFAKNVAKKYKDC